MHPTVLIVAVLLLHGVSGHLFQQDLSQKLTKHLQFPIAKRVTRQSNESVCISDKIEEAFKENATLEAICEAAVLKAENDFDENDFDDNDDDLSQSEVNAVFSVICTPDCGHAFISAADDCGHFDGEDALLKDVFIGLCGTNENGHKCYQIL